MSAQANPSLIDGHSKKTISMKSVISQWVKTFQALEPFYLQNQLHHKVAMTLTNLRPPSSTLDPCKDEAVLIHERIVLNAVQKFRGWSMYFFNVYSTFFTMTEKLDPVLESRLSRLFSLLFDEFSRPRSC